jgi:murein DD-endopeptidase MepM/ murein hydrolase activator NlpD
MRLAVKKSVALVLFIACCSLVALAVMLPARNKNNYTEDSSSIAVQQKSEPVLLYGIPVDSFGVFRGEVREGDFISTILDDYGISAAALDRVISASREIFDTRKIKAGNAYTVFYKEDTTRYCHYFVYEINKVDYITYCFGDSAFAFRASKPVTADTVAVSGIIESSLYEAVADANASAELAMMLANIYAWTVDFYRIQQHDAFKVIYVEEFVESEPVGIREILCASFTTGSKELFAFRFEQSAETGAEYFDAEGNSLRKAFLKMPLEFGRLTSPYNLKRFHPVLKYNKPHLGTDYAAPSGTPILATGDGVVTEASYTSGNGNYVKIKHNSVYSTQYLHMKGFAPGIKKGTRVSQGDVIGYVGSTGLATGPHVCYRFWKNGEQVDPRKEEIPSAEPVSESQRERFNALIQKWKQQLDSLQQPA